VRNLFEYDHGLTTRDIMVPAIPAMDNGYQAYDGHLKWPPQACNVNIHTPHDTGMQRSVSKELKKRSVIVDAF
jgi:hypothetical protein